MSPKRIKTKQKKKNKKERKTTFLVIFFLVCKRLVMSYHPVCITSNSFSNDISDTTKQSIFHIYLHVSLTICFFSLFLPFFYQKVHNVFTIVFKITDTNKTPSRKKQQQQQREKEGKKGKNVNKNENENEMKLIANPT